MASPGPSLTSPPRVSALSRPLDRVRAVPGRSALGDDLRRLVGAADGDQVHAHPIHGVGDGRARLGFLVGSGQHVTDGLIAYRAPLDPGR